MSADQLWQRWTAKDEDAAACCSQRQHLLIASLQVGGEEGEQAGGSAAAAARLVYSPLVDVVEPFVYDAAYEADEHPVRIAAAVELLLTPDHQVWAAPAAVSGGTAAPYRRLSAEKLLAGDWKLMTSVPALQRDADSCFTLPSVGELLAEAEAGEVSLPPQLLHAARLAQSASPSYTFREADMDVLLAFLGFSLAAATAADSRWPLLPLQQQHKEEDSRFLQAVWSRLQCVRRPDGSLLLSSQLETDTGATAASEYAQAPQLALWLFLTVLPLRDGGAHATAPLPRWLWLLSRRQVSILLFGMAHAAGRSHRAEVDCGWCGAVHSEFASVSTTSSALANGLQALASHVGLPATLVLSCSKQPPMYSLTLPPRASSLCTEVTVASSCVHRDSRPAVRQLRFWCVTTAAESSVVLVRRCVEDEQRRETSWLTAYVGNCKPGEEKKAGEGGRQEADNEGGSSSSSDTAASSPLSQSSPPQSARAYYAATEDGSNESPPPPYSGGGAHRMTAADHTAKLQEVFIVRQNAQGGLELIPPEQAATASASSSSSSAASSSSSSPNPPASAQQQQQDLSPGSGHQPSPRRTFSGKRHSGSAQSPMAPLHQQQQQHSLPQQLQQPPFQSSPSHAYRGGTPPRRGSLHNAGPHSPLRNSPSYRGRGLAGQQQPRHPQPPFYYAQQPYPPPYPPADQLPLDAVGGLDDDSGGQQQPQQLPLYQHMQGLGLMSAMQPYQQAAGMMGLISPMQPQMIAQPMPAAGPPQALVSLNPLLMQQQPQHQQQQMQSAHLTAANNQRRDAIRAQLSAAHTASVPCCPAPTITRLSCPPCSLSSSLPLAVLRTAASTTSALRTW